MKSNGKILVLLVSNSLFLLEGISNMIGISNKDIEIATVTVNGKIHEFIALTNPRFVFLDNRASKLDVENFVGLISKTSPDTLIILFRDKESARTFNSSSLIYINNETGSLELINIIKDRRLGQSNASQINKLHS